ncbi:MAG: hypothetical protein AAB442_01755 [Patescibacteria group bacterium]
MEDGFSDQVPPERVRPHYHGDNSRILFVIAAVILVVAKSTGATLPLSTIGTVVTAVILVVLAGITNPAQGWIHWANAVFATVGTLLFGVTAISRYRTGVSMTDPSFVYVEVLALLSLITLYLTTRTIRGFHQRPHLS